MRKMDKKRDNQLRQLLTEVCDIALQQIPGYKWISHNVSYDRYPDSLVITCTFDDTYNAKNAQQQGELLTLIRQKLRTASIELHSEQKQIRFEPR